MFIKTEPKLNILKRRLASIILIFIGICLIIDSVVYITLFNDQLGDQKITQKKLRIDVYENLSYLKGDYNNKKIQKKSTSGFIFREDLSIKNLLTNTYLNKNNHKNNQLIDQSINLKDLDLKTVILNKEIPFYNLKKLPYEFQLIKDVKTKKERFIISILPAIVHENAKIRSERERLLEILNFLISYKTLTINDQKFIENLANEYNINTINKHKIDTIEALLELVDEIPNSIVLAQAANESGWGTSRFAKEYNALFGEYTFNVNNGVEPMYRSHGEKYLIKFFSTINESVESYFHNLNTHPSYKNFREARKQQRGNDLELNSMILVQFLNFYAKDKNYVKTIKSIIKINKLIQFDSVKSVITKS